MRQSIKNSIHIAILRFFTLLLCLACCICAATLSACSTDVTYEYSIRRSLSYMYAEEFTTKIVRSYWEFYDLLYRDGIQPGAPVREEYIDIFENNYLVILNNYTYVYNVDYTVAEVKKSGETLNINVVYEFGTDKTAPTAGCHASIILKLDKSVKINKVKATFTPTGDRCKP